MTKRNRKWNFYRVGGSWAWRLSLRSEHANTLITIGGREFIRVDYLVQHSGISLLTLVVRTWTLKRPFRISTMPLAV